MSDGRDDESGPTPGPWETYRDGDRIHVIREGTLEYLNSSGSHVRADWIAECDPDGTGHSPETIEANARLIASAPDLLDACRATLQQLDYLEGLWGREAITDRLAGRLRAAVAKATGEA